MAKALRDASFAMIDELPDKFPLDLDSPLLKAFMRAPFHPYDKTWLFPMCLHGFINFYVKRFHGGEGIKVGAYGGGGRNGGL